mgnify:CR=1 FL=1
MGDEITVLIAHISSEDLRERIEELFQGEYSYTAEGEWLDGHTVRIKYHAGEYGVVTDELLTKMRSEQMDLSEDDFPNDTQYLYNLLPRSSTVEKGEKYVVSADN